MRKHSYIIPFSLVSITKYDDQLKGICQGTIDFLVRQKIVDLQSQLTVSLKIGGTCENFGGSNKSFALKRVSRRQIFLQNKQNFAQCELALTETSSARLVCLTCFSKFCYLSVFFFCIYELFSPQWWRIISREDIAAGTFKIMVHGKIGPSDVNTSIIPTLIKNYVDANKFNGRKSELLNVASHSISSLV